MNSLKNLRQKYKISQEKKLPIRQAGLEMIEGKHWDTLLEIFRGGKN
jgi:D-ornithine 4,5-aminomutase subunit alpha